MTISIVFRATLVSAVLCGAASSWAQTAQPLDVATGRARIAQQRAEHEAVFAKAEVACYRRFAVSGCLRDARKNRRIALDELRHQEIVLNDKERRFKGEEALQRIQNNISQQAPVGTAP